MCRAFAYARRNKVSAEPWMRDLDIFVFILLCQNDCLSLIFFIERKDSPFICNTLFDECTFNSLAKLYYYNI